MTTHIRSGIVFGICALLLVSSVAIGQEAAADSATAVLFKAPDLVGTYGCVGDASGGGGEYIGTVKITAHGDAYKVQWTVSEVSHKGIGLVFGRTLSVCFVSDGGLQGIVVYKMQKDMETLVGRWTGLDGDGKVLNETLAKIKVGDDK